MSNGIRFRWYDENNGQLANETGRTLYKFRVQLVGHARIAGRKTWSKDIEHWDTDEDFNLVRIERGEPDPYLRMRFRLGTGHSPGPWYTDQISLAIPEPYDIKDPNALGARIFWERLAREDGGGQDT